MRKWLLKQRNVCTSIASFQNWGHSLTKYPKLWRIGNIVGKWHVMNLYHDSDIQSRRYLQVQKWYVPIYSENMTGVDEQNIVALKTIEDRDVDVLHLCLDNLNSRNSEQLVVRIRLNTNDGEGIPFSCILGSS